MFVDLLKQVDVNLINYKTQIYMIQQTITTATNIVSMNENLVTKIIILINEMI